MTNLLNASKNRSGRKAQLLLLSALALWNGFAHTDIYRSLDPNTPTKYANMLPAEGRWELYLKDQAAPITALPIAAVPVAAVPATDDGRFARDTRARFASHIQAAATAHNVEAALIRAVISVESGYNPSAVSKAGAVGLMQLMPGTAKRYNVTDRHDPRQNIHGGAQYLRDLLRLFKNNLQLTLAAYNAGEHAVMKYGNRIPPYRETLAYVPKVMKFYTRYLTGKPSAVKSGDPTISTTAPKNGTRTRVSRTYLAKPA